MNKWLVTLVIHTQQLSLIEWIICWYQKFALQSSTISLFFKNYSIVDVTTYISDLFIRFNKTKFFPRSQRILIETYSKICIYFLYMYIHKDCPIQNFVWNVQGVEGILFCKKNPEMFTFVTLFLPISDKMKLHPLVFHKTVLHYRLEFPRPKTETHKNSTWFFLNHSWKFYFFQSMTPGIST